MMQNEEMLPSNNLTLHIVFTYLFSLLSYLTLRIDEITGKTRLKVYLDLGIFSNVSESFCLKDHKPVTLDQPTVFLASYL